MEELLGVIASNINMQGPDGKTFRTEAAKTLLALTQDASQVDALVDGGAQAHAVATALARTREGARDGLAALANALARANAKGERPADALAVALATPKTVDAACVVAASDAFDPQSRENALAFLQNATVRPAGAAAVAAREEAVTALLKRFARRGAAAAQASWADAFAACAQNLSAAATFRTLLLRPPTRILSALLPLLLDGHVETHGAASPGKRRGVAAALRHCCHDVSAHGVLLDDCCAPQFILFALADASDIARLESDDSMALQLPGGTAWHGAPFVDDASEVYGDSKKREPRADVSLFLLEALLCLCGTRRGRTELRRLKAYAVVRDCDYHFAPGRDDRDEGDGGPSEVLVTADDAPEPPPESLTEEELTLKNVAKACADLAAMLLRDEAGPPGPPTYDDMD